MMTATERQHVRDEIDRAVRARYRLPGRDGQALPTGIEPDVLAVLAEGPAGTKVIVAAVGGSKRRVVAALANLRTDGQIRHVGRGRNIRWTTA
jgi:hypothetical protein